MAVLAELLPCGDALFDVVAMNGGMAFAEIRTATIIIAFATAIGHTWLKRQNGQGGAGRPAAMTGLGRLWSQMPPR